MPQFMPISWRTGPLTTLRQVIEVVLPCRDVVLDAASARMTGKYSGRAPAITALTATFSTVYSQVSRKLPARMRPTTLSGGWLVALSIAATRSSVGSTIGRKWKEREKRMRCLSLCPRAPPRAGGGRPLAGAGGVAVYWGGRVQSVNHL